MQNNNKLVTREALELNNIVTETITTLTNWVDNYDNYEVSKFPILNAYHNKTVAEYQIGKLLPQGGIPMEKIVSDYFRACAALNNIPRNAVRFQLTVLGSKLAHDLLKDIEKLDNVEREYLNGDMDQEDLAVLRDTMSDVFPTFELLYYAVQSVPSIGAVLIKDVVNLEGKFFDKMPMFRNYGFYNTDRVRKINHLPNAWFWEEDYETAYMS